MRDIMARVGRPSPSPALLVLFAVIASGLLTVIPRPLPTEAAGVDHRFMSSIQYPQFVQVSAPWHADSGAQAVDPYSMRGTLPVAGSSKRPGSERQQNARAAHSQR
jgi:hypothetical protein